MSQTGTDLALTPSQETALKKIAAFLEDQDKNVFVLTGYAGTGKTTLMKILHDRLKAKDEDWAVSFHASTGRAAKVLSDKTGIATSTVHSLIYKFNGLNEDFDNIIKDDKKEPILVEDDGQFLLDFTLAEQHEGKILIITDESSMISDKPDEHTLLAKFGTGRLLSDLFTFAPEGKFIFVGDPYQLPPVNDTLSPALNANYLSRMKGKRTVCAELTDIVRQNSENDIIIAADSIRRMCDSLPRYNWVKFPLLGYSHIIIHKDIHDLIMSYTENITSYGYSSCIMISHSNSKCKQYSLLIRDILKFPINRLTNGDLLLVVQNNNICGLMNGDFITVKQIVSEEQRAGLTFIHANVEETDSGYTHSLFLIKELLFSRQTNLTQEQQKNLFIDFHIRTKKRHPGIKQKSKEYIDLMRNDPYVNALRATFGYVVTCHKAQGGEWENIYLDISRHLSRTPPRQNYQWLYTAITRAKENLHIVNDFYLM